VPATLVGQSSSNGPPLAEFKTLPQRFVADELKIWSSPFRKKSYDSHAIKKYVIPLSILSGVMIATDKKTSDSLPNTKDQEVWSGRVSQIGAWYSLVGFSGATFLAGQIAGNAHAKEAGLLAIEALGHTQVVVFAVKQLTNRERPVDGTGNFWGGGNSFPSGHSASSFAVATVFAYEYSDHIAVPIAAYSIASAVSISRLGARRHWMSDVVVGGSLGFLLGRVTYKRNHDPRLPGSPTTRAARLVPRIEVNGSSVVLSWN
jgi:membrane-associated phospholipid phosphatase